MHKFLNMAKQNAFAFDYDPYLEYHLCAIIVKGGKVLSVGYNKQATNSFVEHFTDRVRGMRDYCLSTHAEMDAVLKARSKTDLRGSKIYVARVRRNGELGMARPCSICQTVLHSYGVKRAYYTISDNEYGVMHVKNPENDKTIEV